MDTKTTAEGEFNASQFEKRLTSLKDSQESINALCQWCLQHRVHHKKIVSSWLNVLKRVKMESRLTLFYLANDVIQYSKRRNYEFLESWGTTLQKATTMVRDERIKHKILRIFKIWEQRGVYNEEFLTDLIGLLSATPTARKSDDPHEFQSSYLVNKIRNCTSLENDTDNKLKVLKDHNPKIQLDKAETLCANLKDRAHVDDVEKEIDVYASHMEAYVTALKLETKARSNLISLLMQAETQLESDRKDVKLVANAYRTFGARIKNVKKKLDEILPTLSSPIPSPDINAPSPSPDSDIDLPGSDNSIVNIITTNSGQTLQYQNAGYYNPLQSTTTESNTNFTNNGFSSFMGSNMPFNVQNFTPSSLFATDSIQNTVANSSDVTQTTDSFDLNTSISSLFSSISQPPPPPEAVPPPLPAPVYQGVPAPVITTVYQGVPAPIVTTAWNTANHMPLLPPPMPPFSKADSGYGSSTVYSDSYNSSTATTYDEPFQPGLENYQNPPYPEPAPTTYPDVAPTVYPNSLDSSAYEPQENWEQDPNWIQTSLDTPESPPMFEKEAFSDPPLEYHDTVDHGSSTGDVDHRVLLKLPSPPVDNSSLGHRGKDVDHRNLISLTGSPADSSSNPNTSDSVWNVLIDQDYRKPPQQPPNNAVAIDQDYRIPFNIEQLKLPPPPPPPKTPTPNLNATPPKLSNMSKMPGASPKKFQDNVESIDMDLSDDEGQIIPDNLKVLVDPTADVTADPTSDVTADLASDSRPLAFLEPPPPLPDLPEDVDANNFLDDLSNDLNSADFTANLADEPPAFPPSPMWNVPPQMCNVPPPNVPWMEQAPPPPFNPEPTAGWNGRGNKRGSFNRRGRNGEFRGRGNRHFRGGGYRGGPMRGNRGRGRMGHFRGNYNNSGY